jgi:hypothetical protein
MRQKFDSDADGANVQAGDKVQKDQGAARAISSFIDAGLCWKDLDWFKSITKSTSLSPLPASSPLSLNLQMTDSWTLLSPSADRVLTFLSRSRAARI